jgi:hypothetical protein
MMYSLGLLNVDLETARRRLRDVFDEPAGTLGVAVGTSISHLLAAKGASKKGYDSCLHALASVDPNSPAAGHIASSLASFAVIQHRLNQQPSIVEYTAESVRQPTQERRYAA